MLILFIQTFLLVLFLGNVFQIMWFSYVLFIVYIGGILILFFYIISLINNKLFNFNKPLLLYLLRFILIYLIFFLKTKNILNFDFLNLEYKFKDFNFLNWYKLYNFYSNFLNIFIINFLFFILIITIKLTKRFFGPLRIKLN